MCFICKAENWNIISGLIKWIDSLEDTPKDIAKTVIYVAYSIFVFFNMYAWFSLISIKEYKERKGWLKNVFLKLWHRID